MVCCFSASAKLLGRSVGYQLEHRKQLPALDNTEQQKLSLEHFDGFVGGWFEMSPGRHGRIRFPCYSAFDSSNRRMAFRGQDDTPGPRPDDTCSTMARISFLDITTAVQIPPTPAMPETEPCSAESLRKTGRRHVPYSLLRYTRTHRLLKAVRTCPHFSQPRADMSARVQSRGQTCLFLCMQAAQVYATRRRCRESPCVWYRSWEPFRFAPLHG